VLPYGLADVAGRSMLPTLRPGDVVVVRWRARVSAGDVVVVRRPDRPGLNVVKRAARREAGGWWVLGDNPAESDDSRVFGVVPDAAVVARVLARPWPQRLLRRRHVCHNRDRG
jgi:nickel-type superoxide dismutase maturation protease